MKLRLFLGQVGFAYSRYGHATYLHLYPIGKTCYTWRIAR
jgi:hypothetical protein